MDYRVEELAEAAGVRVDTIRFYQGKGLLPAPERRGRIAIYVDDHLERLRRIRDLLSQGFRLAQIERLFAAESKELQEPLGPLGPKEPAGLQTREGGRGTPTETLLRELVAERVGRRTLTRTELASESGVPEPLLQAAQAAGLIEPVVIDGEERFAEADLDMARTGLGILGAGFPLDEFLKLAIAHARGVAEVADRAIDLFDDHVRSAGPDAGNDRAVTEAFQVLLPRVTRLVALHFQRTLVNRALERLRASGDTDLAAALVAAESAKLEVEWRS